MYLRILPFFIPLIGIITLVGSTALAQNSVMIEQLGPGSIEVLQNGKNNSSEIHQINKGISSSASAEAAQAVSPLGTPNNPNYIDYQKSILDNPYTSAQARAQVLTDPKDTVQKDAAQGDEGKKLAGNPDLTAENRIHIVQKGTHNQSTTRQQGRSNDLTLEQAGTVNEYTRTQSGAQNHSRIQQNGTVTEDKQTDN